MLFTQLHSFFFFKYNYNKRSSAEMYESTFIKLKQTHIGTALILIPLAEFDLTCISYLNLLFSWLHN